MDKLVIEGGVPLVGEVRISGAKNAALPILLATLLHSGPSRVTNVPRLQDIRTTLSLMEHLGVVVDEAEGGVVLECSTINSAKASYDLVRKMRASVLCLGPLLARNGFARVSLPGGCAIGTRPIDQHLRGLEAMGVRVEETEDSLTVHGMGPGGVPGGGVAAARLDHRIAMAFLCLGLAAKAPVAVDDASPIDTSFPNFVPLMRALGAMFEG